MAINKVQFGNQTLIDLTSDTVTADKLMQGYTAHDRTGALITGTATGGGTGGNVWQDAQGYVHLDDEGTAPITVEPLSVTQNGTYTAPTGKAYSPVTVNVSGGGGDTPWVRPSDWPDLSQMDVSAGDIIYMTSYADEARGFCNIAVTCTGSYTVEVGTITGSTFTAESTHTVSSGTRCRLYYGSASGAYKVLRVTGTVITKFSLGGETTAITIDTFHGYTCNNGIIDVVGKLPSCTVMSHSYCYNLVNMEIDDVVLSGSMSSMFAYCYSLISLDVSSWNTSAVTTMNSMFNYCCSLISLDVSGWNTSAVTNMSNMFQNCYSLTSLDVSSWNTSAVTTMYSMFAYCYSLISLDVSSWNTSAVTTMNSMFNYCCSLISLDVSGWNTSAVTTMYSMFAYCCSLISLDVSGWNTSAVTNMSSTFKYCASLALLDISDWDTSLVTNMSGIFNYCYALTSLDVSGWDFSKVTTAANTSAMFGYCRGLHGSITIPASVTQIGSHYLTDTQSLYEYHFLSTTPPTLANTNAFNNMTDFGGKKIYVPSASLEAYQTATNWSTYASYMVGE